MQHVATSIKRSVVLSVLALAACTHEPTPAEQVGATAEKVDGFDTEGAPPFVTRVLVSGYFSPNPNAALEHRSCWGAVVASGPRATWVVTAAHCFQSFFVGGKPGFPKVDTDYGIVLPERLQFDVRFHPNTFNGVTSWTDMVSGIGSGDIFLYDIALVRLPPDLSKPLPEPLKLWAPVDDKAAAAALAATKAVLQVTGHDGNGNTAATGHQTALGYGVNGILLGDANPAKIFPGDSGAPTYRELTADLPPSFPTFGITCAVTPAAQSSVVPAKKGDLMLVGINQASISGQVSQNAHVPTFRPDIVQWIAKTTAADFDGDGVCDGEDNCIARPNANQQNHNTHAEDAWGGSVDASIGNGNHLGDDCDPGPTPFPVLGPSAQSAFVSSSSPYFWLSNVGDKFFLVGGGAQNGREIDDKLTILPVLEDGSHLFNSTATPRFCDCRGLDGQPLADLDACKKAPYNCFLDPRQAQLGVIEAKADQASVANGVTAWHLVTTASPTAKGAGYEVDYEHFGNPMSATWDYAADFDFWVNKKKWMTAPQPDPNYIAGTDLGGALWGHDDTKTGAEAHTGIVPLCFTGDCIASIADGFAFGVAPDQKVIAKSASLIATENFKLADFTAFMCPPNCPSPRLGGGLAAEPYLTVDSSLAATLWYPNKGGRDATNRVSASFRAALTNPDALFIPPSEPSTLRSDEAITRVLGGQPPGPQAASSPRALVILPEPGGFSLHAQVALPDGTMDLAKVESFGAEVVAELSRFLGDPVKRSQLAVVYARTANALFIVHASDPASPPLPPRVLQRLAPSPIVPAQAWQMRPASMSGTLHPTTRAVYSMRDWRIWALERPNEPHATWRLRRIDPMTGQEETRLLLPALDGYDALWLTSWEDGRVLLIADRRSHRQREGHKNADKNEKNSKDDKQKGDPKKSGQDKADDNEADGNDSRDGQFAVALLSSEPFRSNGKLTVEGVHVGKGRVLMAPKVSAGVLSLFVARHGKNSEVEVIGLRRDDFAGSWDELAESLGGANVELD